MSWQEQVKGAQVTPEQLVVARIDLVEHGKLQAAPDAPDVSKIEFLRRRWPEWGEVGAGAAVARLSALAELRECGGLEGIDLLEAAVMTATAEAPIAVVNGSWTLDWARFIAIAHDANRSEMQGLGLGPCDEIAEEPPEAANDDGDVK